MFLLARTQEQITFIWKELDCGARGDDRRKQGEGGILELQKIHKSYIRSIDGSLPVQAKFRFS